MLTAVAIALLSQIGRPEAGFFGQSIAAIGDVDGDGFEDLAVGAPRWGGEYPGPTGCVFVLSGSTAEELGCWRPSADARSRGEGHGFGATLVPAGDLDGDGRTDVLIGAQGPIGTFAWSARTGTRLFGLDVATVDVQPLGDLDGDGCADLLVTREAGWTVVAGKDGTTLAEVGDPPAERALLLEDGNGDGLRDGVSADGGSTLMSRRIEGGSLAFDARPTDLPGGEGPGERVEVAPGLGGVRHLLTTAVRDGALMLRLHRSAADGLVPLVPRGIEVAAPAEENLDIHAVALPHGDGHDLIVAARQHWTVFEIPVHRRRPGEAEPLWTRPLFYPSQPQIALAPIECPGGCAPRVAVGTAETGRRGSFRGEGQLYILDGESGEVLVTVEERSTRLGARFDAHTIGSKRVLVIEGTPGACARQREIVEANADAADERGLVLVELRGAVVIEHVGTLGLQVPAEFLRRRARLDRLPFQAVLLDLDGDDVHRAFAPVPWRELFGLISREPGARRSR